MFHFMEKTKPLRDDIGAMLTPLLHFLSMNHQNHCLFSLKLNFIHLSLRRYIILYGLNFVMKICLEKDFNICGVCLLHLLKGGIPGKGELGSL